MVLERNIGSNTGLELNGPRLDYDILFETPGTYNVHLRMRATIANNVASTPNLNDSVHVGLNGVAVTNASGFGVGVDSPTWEFTNDVLDGLQDVTVTVAEAGIHTLNIWGREDGTELDRIVLTTSATAPSGFGPAESPTLGASPVAGDYDLDFDVDPFDYDVFLESYGSNAAAWADGNQDGVVNASDYAVWREAFAASQLQTSGASDVVETIQGPGSVVGSADSVALAPVIVAGLSANSQTGTNITPHSRPVSGVEAFTVDSALLLVLQEREPGVLEDVDEEVFGAALDELTGATDKAETGTDDDETSLRLLGD